MTVDFDFFIILIFILLFIGIFLFLRFKKKKTFVYMFFFTIFFIYIIEVIKYTQFPIYLSKYMRNEVGQTVWKDMNLIPLITLKYAALKTSLMNILLTIPFGFGLPFFSDIHMRKMIFTSALFSIILELLQLIEALFAGFTFRVVDINDVIFNIIGAIIGYILFVGFMRGYRWVFDRWHIQQNVILQYIYERSKALECVDSCILYKD